MLFQSTIMMTRRMAMPACAGFIVLTCSPLAYADLPISGRPVPQLTWLDDTIESFMESSDISAGVVGIMRNDKIVYLRGFGSDYAGANLPENTPMRLASVSKAVTAAAVRHLVDTGQIAMTDNAFNLGQPGGGILDLDPFPTLGDARFANIQVQHLLVHQGGWDPGAAGDDFAFNDIECAQDMNIASPPGRVNKLRWIMGKPLQFTPGMQTQYSNINYHVLHEIVVQVSGMPLEQYVWWHILTPAMWVPLTEIHTSGTFRNWQDPREPAYESIYTGPNVFNPSQTVARPYGTWHHEAMTGYGGFAATATTMLVLANTYYINAFSMNIGRPLAEFSPNWSSTGPVDYNGSLPGTNTCLRQFNGSTGNFRVFVGFNSRPEPCDSNCQWSQQLMDLIWPGIVAASQTWPSTTSDGFWTMPQTGGSAGLGGYHRPFRGLQQMLDNTASGSKIRLFSGSTNWTGTISRRVQFDAPLGTVTIGQQ